MINVTDSAIVNKIKGTGRIFTLSLVVGKNTYTMVKSLKRSSIFASSQKLSVGETVSAFIEAEIQNCRKSLQNYEVQPILSIDEYDIPLGIFKVQAPSQADGSGTQKITAYDRMAETSKYTYKATGLTSAKATFSAICTTCNYTAVTNGLTDVDINDRLLDGMDCRKALGYVAGIFGKNCVVGTDGKFKMVGYSTVSESVCKISIDSLDTLEFPSKVSTIDYFNALVTEETAYKSGTGNNGVNIVNPLFKSDTQTSNILTNLQSSVGGDGYYPAKFKQLNGDPRIEVGDVIKVEHRDISTGGVTADYVPVMSLTLDYDGGVTVSIEAYPTEDEFSMSLSDKVDFTNSSNNAKLEDINNKVDGFEEGINGANTKADFATVRANAVEELNDLISNSLGLYRTEIEGAGGDIKYYFHNAEDISKSNYIVAFTDKGFSVTNDWNNGNPSWSYGMNPAGNSIMNYLVVNKISADLIKAGVIRSLDGAPVNTEFSLNTGLFSLESNSQKELFGFGTNKDNHLLLQCNYSDGEKNNIKLGYYYSGQFYKDSGYTEIIPPNEKYYYGDMPTGKFYQYSSNRYTVMSDLTEVLKTYKGFILHPCGRTVGYDKNNQEFGIVSDFNTNMEMLLGGNLGIVEDIEDTPKARTPILKFYDFEKESVDGQSHYTAIRKQSIVTKHLGAETFCFYLDGKVTDLETILLTLISSAEDYQTKIEGLETTIQGLETTVADLNDDLSTLQTAIRVLPDYKTRIESLEKAVTQLNELLGVKVLKIYVRANPIEGGSVSGSGSYSLDDREVLIEATANENYYILNVECVYASDGRKTTLEPSNNTNYYNFYWKIEAERLGDTLDVTVNFAKKLKLTLSAEPTEGGTVKCDAVSNGVGYFFPNDLVRFEAVLNPGYKFLGWYEGDDRAYTELVEEINIERDMNLTAKFESTTLTVEVKSYNAIGDDTVYLCSEPNGGTHLGTVTTLNVGEICYVHAEASAGRRIEKMVSKSGGVSTAEELEASGHLTPDHTVLNYPIPGVPTNIGKTFVRTVYFAKADTGSGGGDETEYYTVDVQSDNTNYGTVSGGGSNLESGTTITITATPKSGYKFSHWNDGDTNASRTITVTGNATYTAYFEVDTSGGGSDEILNSGDTITEGVEVFVNIPTQNKEVWLDFKPNYSGSYTFESIGGDGLDYSVVDPDGTIYRSDTGERLAYDSSSGGFSVTYDDFVAGNTYLLAAKLYSGTGTLKVKVSYNGSSSGGGSGDTVVITTSGYVKVYHNGVEITQTSGWSYTFNVGDRVRLEAISRSGHVFSGDWIINGSIVKKGDVIDFTSITTNDAGNYAPLYE